MAIINYIIDGADFATVNASTNTQITSNLPQGAVNFYNPIMAVGTWYRYYNVLDTKVYETSNSLVLISLTEAPQNGILQKLSGLIAGTNYNIQINSESITGTARILIYSGLSLKSTHILTGSEIQIINFQATTTNDTIVIDTVYTGTDNEIKINSLTITEALSNIGFKSGFFVKPLSISNIGNVTFTSGNDINGIPVAINPNQIQCESYGYTYNPQLGTCTAYRYNNILNTNIANINNKIYGTGNKTNPETNTTLIMGENNTIKGNSKNSILTGGYNEIANGVNNANVSGFLGEATASNSIVLGGNTDGDILGERQFIRCIYGATTTSNATVSSSLNNETGIRFVIPDNTIIYFHADTVVVRTGGINRSGAVGDYGSYVERGVIINKSGTTTIQRERDTIKTSGTVTNWRILAETGGAAGTILKLSCRGQTGMTLEWCMNVSITQIKTGVTL
tara:strand:+ start:5026 stop:6381 length:1356 start_codon:yes stop_codon:yes gene_type:complete